MIINYEISDNLDLAYLIKQLISLPVKNQEMIIEIIHSLSFWQDYLQEDENEINKTINSELDPPIDIEEKRHKNDKIN